MNFYRRSKRILGTLPCCNEFLLINSYYTLAQIFPEFHTWVQSSLAGEKLFDGDMRKGREEVFTYAAFFVCHHVA